MQDEDTYLIFEQLVQEYGAVTYEAFINLLVSLISSEYGENPSMHDARSTSQRIKLPLNSFVNPSVVSQRIK